MNLYCDHSVTLAGKRFICAREPHKGNTHYMMNEERLYNLDFTDSPATFRALCRTFALLVGVPIGAFAVTVLTLSLVIHR